MSRINKAFENKKAFIAFVTAGDPTLEKTKEYVLGMIKAGADLVELGIPFSDPIAEGPVIQTANVRALSNNVRTNNIFDLVREIRKETDVPLVFLCYLNTVFKYGYERFCETCKEVGIDGIIIPDMPYEEKGELLPIAKANDVDLITMIAPTSNERIREIAKDATGFIYVVSSLGVTGVRDAITTDVRAIVEEIKKVSDTPACIGFGISKPEQVKEYTSYADGAIVGSAIVKLCEKYGENALEPITEYVSEMAKAAHGEA
ncbi:MAG: tryptophan synthase subunit alpha [Lachnospiraceae bacterium]|nr:tryptophan synthase subunit alpha [Lachnospiraceae bacterium]